MRGIERRIAAGLDPRIGSVASLFVSRWDVAVKDKVPPALRNRLGIAIAKRTYKAYRDVLASPRWRELAAAGARPQRLLWASTGTKDPTASDTLYVEALAAPDTINTIPEKTLRAFADHGRVRGAMPVDGGDAEDVIAEFARRGWTRRRSPPSSSARAPNRSTSRGRICWRVLPRRARSWRRAVTGYGTSMITGRTAPTPRLTERPAWEESHDSSTAALIRRYVDSRTEGVMTARGGTIDDLCINTIRTLSIDAVEQAASGHPGCPWARRAMAYVLWTRHLRHDPAQTRNGSIATGSCSRRGTGARCSTACCS